MNRLKTMLLSFILALSAMTVNAGQIKIDEGVAPQAGSISYDGIGGALIGTGINFTSALGINTLLENGTSLSCTGCSMSFMTGLNTLEGPALWQWAAGGSLAFTGTLFDGVTQIATGNLLTGTFGAPPVPTFAGGGSGGLFLSVGDITANADLVNFFGFGNGAFDFAHTTLSLESCQFAANGGFGCGLNNADLNLTNAVPAPGTLALLGAGMLLVARSRRGKQS